MSQWILCMHSSEHQKTGKEIGMKRLSREAVKVCLCTTAVVVSIVVSLVVLSELFLPRGDQRALGATKNETLALGILKEPENSIDVLFIGDSEAYSAFSPLQIWEEHGFTSYVCATPGQQMPYGNTLLRRATNSQRPQVIVIETDMVYKSFNYENAIRRTFQDMFPVFEYHDRWKVLIAEGKLSKDSVVTVKTDTKGFWTNATTSPASSVGHMTESANVQAIPELNDQYLRRMIAYCREIGAVPLLVSTPSTVNWSTPKHNGIAAFAQSVGVDYIDLNTEPTKVDIDWRRDTRDAGDHLNYSGARKVSSFIGAYLSEKYNLVDRRGDTNYQLWNEALERFNESMKRVGTGA